MEWCEKGTELWPRPARRVSPEQAEQVSGGFVPSSVPSEGNVGNAVLRFLSNSRNTLLLVWNTLYKVLKAMAA